MNSENTDIQNREDLYAIVQLFYEKHLLVLVDFWDNILFYSGTYTKNAMTPHIEMDKKMPFKSHHFELWLTYFKLAVDSLFAGEQAEIIKARAQSIATVMQIKIIH